LKKKNNANKKGKIKIMRKILKIKIIHHKLGLKGELQNQKYFYKMAKKK
jgi:hypothetical protein